MRTVESRFPALSNAWWSTLVALGILLAWDASGLDLLVARLMGGSQGFPMQEHWAVAGVLHKGGRQLAWLFGLWLLAGLWWPTGVMRQLSRAAVIQWLASVLLSALLINALKHSSQTSCPWDLAEFGGAARYLSHWAWGQPDGGPGHCFPAGHASAGFAFLGGYFALRGVSQRVAGQYVAAVAAAGLVLGVAQQLRGAHFLSHTLWTGWLCWVVACGVNTAAEMFRSSSVARPASPL